MAVAALEVLVSLRKNWPVEGRNTPTPSTPSAFQSPAVGKSPLVPKLKMAEALLDVRVSSRKNCPVVGRNTPTSSLPSLFQSPATGKSPACPKLKLIVVMIVVGGHNGQSFVVTGWRSRNWPLRNTPTSSVPSPFQSPATGRSPACPKVNEGRVSKLVEKVKGHVRQLWTKTVFSVARRKVPFRKTPMSVRPSPFQSPVTGKSPA